MREISIHGIDKYMLKSTRNRANKEDVHEALIMAKGLPTDTDEGQTVEAGAYSRLHFLFSVIEVLILLICYCCRMERCSSRESKACVPA